MTLFRQANSLQKNLWEPGCGACFAFDQCGGSSTAPCGCVRTGVDYRKCSECPISCVEREVKEGDEIVDSFRIRLREGLPVQALHIAQPIDLVFPSLLLSRTDSLPKTEIIEDEWVGVHLKALVPLFRRWKHGPRQTAESLRKRLRVDRETKLVGILNGTDDLLEKLWSFDRADVFETLRMTGIRVITGPTFSVYGEGPETPSSHNITMLQRHHRLCSEASSAGLVVLPNVYWRNARDSFTWAKWLAGNQEVFWIARDFSRTKQWACFEPELTGLVDLIRHAARQINVMVTGVGEDKMTATKARLKDVGSDCTFVTCRPLVAPPILLPGQTRAAGIRESIAAFRLLADNGSCVESEQESVAGSTTGLTEHPA